MRHLAGLSYSPRVCLSATTLKTSYTRSCLIARASPRTAECSPKMSWAHPLESAIWSWRGGSVIKSIVCSFGGPRFDSQHLHGDSQLCVTPVPRNLTPLPLSAGTRHAHIHTCRQSTLHIKQKVKLFLAIRVQHWGSHIITPATHL